MSNKFLIIFIISLLPVKIFAANNVDQGKAVTFQKLKSALLAKNMELVHQIEKEDPAIWSYVDPKTGQMMIHEIFRYSYPEKSIEYVINSTPSSLMRTKDGQGNSPMHYFMQKADGYSEEECQNIFELLSHKSVSLFSKNNAGVTPFHLAAKMHNSVFLKEILNLLPDGYKENGLLDWKDKHGKTPLMYAVDHGRKANIYMLLQRGALFDQNFIEYLRNYYHKNIDAEILRQNISDPEQQKELKNSYIKHTNQVMMILAVHAHKFNPDFYTILTDALKSGIDINAQDVKGNTLLHYAMANYSDNNGILNTRNRQNNNAMVSTLLALGANPELRNLYENAPDLFDLYSEELEYYKNLRNFLEMDEKRDTLVGQLMMKAYEDWFYHDNPDLLKNMMCDDETNKGSLLTKQKAREFFKPEFISQICS